MQRDALLNDLASAVLAINLPHPTRVAIDGFTASGKTTLAEKLGGRLERRGKDVVRASLDDFKRPWAERHLYDRESGDGYYRNAYDYDLVRRVLLDPLGPSGDRHYQSGHIDPATQRLIDDATGIAADDAILIVDAVFLFRPEINDCWDFRIFVDIGLDLVLERGLQRDHQQETTFAELERVYQDRYIESERIYCAEVDPMGLADIVIDNRDFSDPKLRWRQPHTG